MAVKVLIVDDSGFFRRRLSDILGADERIEIVGAASNGQEGVDMACKLRPDVITMDYEMPVLDGISAVRQIMQTCPTAVLMFSSLTHEGARITLDALEAGAVDYLPKNFEDISRNPQKVRQLLCDKVMEISRSNRGGLSRRVRSTRPPSPVVPGGLTARLRAPTPTTAPVLHAW